MTIYDDMRGYVHVHDRNGWFDVTTETTPMYQMIDKADAENAKLLELVQDMCDLLPHADWPSTECDEKASACIDQAIELGIEADA